MCITVYNSVGESNVGFVGSLARKNLQIKEMINVEWIGGFTPMCGLSQTIKITAMCVCVS